MAIPDYQAVMLPLLKFLGDGEVHSKREAVENLANEFNLTDQERKELLPSGQQPIFGNRVGWARTYLTKAGLVKSIRRG
jgi:restriction system protein